MHFTSTTLVAFLAATVNAQYGAAPVSTDVSPSPSVPAGGASEGPAVYPTVLSSAASSAASSVVETPVASSVVETPLASSVATPVVASSAATPVVPSSAATPVVPSSAPYPIIPSLATSVPAGAASPTGVAGTISVSIQPSGTGAVQPSGSSTAPFEGAGVQLKGSVMGLLVAGGVAMML